MGIDSDTYNLNGFRNLESTGIVDGTQRSSVETYDCLNEAWQSRITVDYCRQQQTKTGKN